MECDIFVDFIVLLKKYETFWSVELLFIIAIDIISNGLPFDTSFFIN